MTAKQSEKCIFSLKSLKENEKIEVKTDTSTKNGSKLMFYPQFDMCPPPEPFFSRAGGRKRSRVQIIGFLGLHAVTPHELLEEHGGPQMISRLTQFKVSQH